METVHMKSCHDNGAKPIYNSPYMNVVMKIHLPSQLFWAEGEGFGWIKNLTVAGSLPIFALMKSWNPHKLCGKIVHAEWVLQPSSFDVYFQICSYVSTCSYISMALNSGFSIFQPETFPSVLRREAQELGYHCPTSTPHGVVEDRVLGRVESLANRAWFIFVSTIGNGLCSGPIWIYQRVNNSV